MSTIVIVIFMIYILFFHPMQIKKLIQNEHCVKHKFHVVNYDVCDCPS